MYMQKNIDIKNLKEYIYIYIYYIYMDKNYNIFQMASFNRTMIFLKLSTNLIFI